MKEPQEIHKKVTKENVLHYVYRHRLLTFIFGLTGHFLINECLFRD